MTWFDELLKHVEDLKAENVDFYEKKIGASGDRMRKGLQAIKVLAQQGRKDISEKKPIFKAEKQAAKNASKA